MGNNFFNWLIRNRVSGKFTIMLFLLIFISLLTGCERENGYNFSADFSYDFIDNNRVRFTSESEGEYYSLFWDFGNGDTLSTTDKNKKVEVYYPLAGDYEVRLVVYNYTGQSQSATKTISVVSDDLRIGFSAEIDPEDPNYVLLENKTTGNYDSFKWIYRNREVENAEELRAYFPFRGQHKIELYVTKGTDTFSSEKTVTISEDDEDYPDKLILVWEDKFNGSSVNPEDWTFETGAGGWGNNELQNYTSGENAEIVNGKLIITARKVNDEKQPGSYTSSRIITMNKKEFRYGRMEIRAKLPSGKGIWPAIWMLGSNFKSAGWPACGEIDIMEYVGYEPNTVHSTLHTPSSYGNSVNGVTVSLESCEEEFHNYGIIWTEKYISFYIDTPGNITYTYAPANKNSNTWPFDQPFFFILNIAVGGTWGGAQGIDNAIFPQTMEVDYVKVYQEPL
jgi:beta-glucanase (GH16 family)